jgi:hypothetical protein
MISQIPVSIIGKKVACRLSYLEKNVIVLREPMDISSLPLLPFFFSFVFGLVCLFFVFRFIFCFVFYFDCPPPAFSFHCSIVPLTYSFCLRHYSYSYFESEVVNISKDGKSRFTYFLVKLVEQVRVRRRNGLSKFV